jgi:hypothetical protein
LNLHGNYASEPCTDENQEKLILLCTHNRVQGKSETRQFNEYQNKSRTLLIWDESLMGIGYGRDEERNESLDKFALERYTKSYTNCPES